MTIYYFIVVFFGCFIKKYYKRALFVWAGVSITMHPGICLKFSSPAISVLLTVNLIFLAFHLYKRKGHNKRDFNKFTLRPILVFVLLSSICSAIWGILPFSRSLITIIGYSINSFLIIYLLDLYVNTLQDLLVLFKYVSTVVILGVIYGTITLIIGYNPIIEWQQTFIPKEMSDKLVDSFITHRGVKMQSFYGGATQFAAFCSLTAIGFLSIYRNLKYKIKITYVIILFLTIFTAFLSKTRAGIIAAIICVMYFITTLKTSQAIKTCILSSIILLALLSFFTENSEYITSIFDSRAQDQVGGSSLDMRIRQGEIVWKIFTKYPLFGAGVGSLGVYTSTNYELYGAESVWFQLIIQRGVIGVICYCYIFIFTIRLISPKMRIYIYMAALFWIVLHTLSTTGLSEYFYLLIFLIIYKIDRLYINYENRHNHISRF